MAKKEGVRVNVQMRSTESHYMYMLSKNKRNNPERLELRKYDPVLRKHVAFKEKK
jgi:large subunit ribosomal protein L33